LRSKAHLVVGGRLLLWMISLLRLQ
jgi:hypothetical protein